MKRMVIDLIAITIILIDLQIIECFITQAVLHDILVGFLIGLTYFAHDTVTWLLTLKRS